MDLQTTYALSCIDSSKISIAWDCMEWSNVIIPVSFESGSHNSLNGISQNSFVIFPQLIWDKVLASTLLLPDQ